MEHECVGSAYATAIDGIALVTQERRPFTGSEVRTTLRSIAQGGILTQATFPLATQAGVKEEKAQLIGTHFGHHGQVSDLDSKRKAVHRNSMDRLCTGVRVSGVAT